MKHQSREPHAKVQLQLGDKQEKANAELFRLIKIHVGKNPPLIGALCCPSHAIARQTNYTEHHVSLALKCAGPFQGMGRNLLHRTPKGEKEHNFFLPL